jgi:hypothetical protein
VPADETVIRTELILNGRSFLLAQGQDIAALRARIEEATQGTGAFVDFTIVGNRSLSVLVSPAARVVFATETVPFDPRDTGDEQAPYGEMFDAI